MIDWKQLRENYFKECVENNKVSYAPHDLFEWFKNNIEPDNDLLITTDWLMKKHPELHLLQASSLLTYCNNNTIKYKSCYGNGEVMLKEWKGSLGI